jgi:type VI secretion system protein ImpL
MLNSVKLMIGAAVGFSLYAVLVYFIPGLAGLDGQVAWILRLVLTAIGAAVIGYIAYRKDQQNREAAEAEEGEGDGGVPVDASNDEIDAAVVAAQQRLTGAKLAGGGKIGTLPAVLLFGPEGSTKTTTVVRAGVEPELLAGEVFHGDQIVPTSGINLWYARGAVFAEASGGVTADAGRRARFLQRLRPQSLGAALGRGSLAPRVAVVCFPCDEFLKPGSTEAVPAAARQLRQAMGEAAEKLGIKLPVYVLFTKADRVPGFADYVQNLNRDEVREPLGATLPTMEVTGTYAEQQTARLTEAFRRLYESLATRRLLVLHREHAAERKPGAYEFPREFRKIAPLAMQFLVELGRPSQLAVSQYVRGFYFTGVRAIVVNEQVAAPAPAASGSSSIAGATGVFGALRAPHGGVAPAAPAAAVQKKKPQWVFLERLFPEIVLADQAALSATTGGTSVSGLRRSMLAAAAVLALVVGAGFTISYFGNRALERDTIAAGEGARGATVAAAAAGAAAALPEADALHRLDSLRLMVARLGEYRVEGAPLRLRWALYAGNKIEPDARVLYFQEFERVMFGATRESMLRSLRGLPDSLSEVAPYGDTYDLLKGYLITARHPDKSSVEFLPPVLMRAWLDGRQLDSTRAQLARKQFDFYAAALLRDGDPYTHVAHEPTVEHARDYLLQFAGADRVYQFMTSQAARQNPGVQFNRAVPGSAAYLVNGYEVPGAFTAGGWKFMQDALKNVDRFLQGEEWVLGPRMNAANVDRARIALELKQRYEQDFVRHWRQYLKSGTVVRYGSLRDAATKLQAHSGPNSPVLAMLALAARNTGVDSAGMISKAFQPVHAVTPPTVLDKYVVEQNAPYVQALAGLGAAIEQTAAAPPAQLEMMAQTASSNASQAKLTVNQLATTFSLDPEAQVDRTVQALLMAPITSVEGYLKNMGSAELNAAGASFCSSYSRIMNKYPFNPNATNEATVAEVAAMFKPGTGLLYTVYDEVLQKVLVKQGTTVAARPGAPARPNQGFISFYNRAILFSEAFFKDGAQEPRLAFSLRSTVSDPVTGVTVALDQQVARFTAANSDPAPFVWQASQSQSARLGGVFGGGSELNLQGPFNGPWALFKLFHRAEKWSGSGGVYTVEWPVRMPGQALTRPDGSPVTVTVQMNLGGLPPVLQRGYFDSLRCVSRVAD